MQEDNTADATEAAPTAVEATPRNNTAPRPRPAHKPRQPAANTTNVPALPPPPPEAVKALLATIAAGDVEGVRATLTSEPAPARAWQPIHDAAEDGRVEIVQALLDAGADPNALSPAAPRYRPLHRVIEPRRTGRKGQRHVETVKALLAGGADASARATWCNLTPVALAAFGGQSQFLPHLLSFLDHLDFYTAAALGRADVVAMMLKRDSSRATRKDANGMAALHYCAASRLGTGDDAAAARLARVAGLLLDAGADAAAPADVGDGHARPPLDWASAAGNRTVLDVFLARGADATIGLTPALWAGDYATADYLAGRGADATDARLEKMVCAFAKWGLFAQSRWLVEHGAGANGLSSDGRTALHHACSRGATAEYVECLLAAGADAGALDAGGVTPLQLAQQKNKPKLVALLAGRAAA